MTNKKNVNFDICKYIERVLPRSRYKLIRNYVDIDHGHSAAIMTMEGPYCIIYEKNEIEKDRNFLNSIKAKMHNEGIRYAIIIVNEQKKYSFVEKQSESKEYKDEEKIKEKILNILEQNDGEYNKKLICKYFKDNLWFDVKDTEIEFDNDKNECSIEGEKESKLVGNFFNFQNFSGTVYRYIPLKSLFETLKSGNIRMSGIAGMNDVSEVDYVEKMLYDGASPLDPEIGKVYIMSCSINKEDDLTQWRLYGDDGKGACLTFKVKDEVKNEEKKFIFQKIKYINDGGYYKPLKQLKELIKYVRQVTGYTFVFKSFHDWSHFIKPKDYEVESEARVLYHVKDKNENKHKHFFHFLIQKSHHVKDKNENKHKPENWIFTNRNIANPYADIPLDEEEFPLELVEIKLGPKCPEFETNKSQLEALIKENDQIKNKKIIISKSKIEHYR